MRALHQKYGKFVRTGKFHGLRANESDLIVYSGPNTVSIYSSQPISMIYSAASAWNKSTAYNVSGPGYGLFFIQDREIHNDVDDTFGHQRLQQKRMNISRYAEQRILLIFIVYIDYLAMNQCSSVAQRIC